MRVYRLQLQFYHQCTIHVCLQYEKLCLRYNSAWSSLRQLRKSQHNFSHCLHRCNDRWSGSDIYLVWYSGFSCQYNILYLTAKKGRSEKSTTGMKCLHWGLWIIFSWNRNQQKVAFIATHFIGISRGAARNSGAHGRIWQWAPMYNLISYSTIFQAPISQVPLESP